MAFHVIVRKHWFSYETPPDPVNLHVSKENLVRRDQVKSYTEPILSPYFNF